MDDTYVKEENKLEVCRLCLDLVTNDGDIYFLDSVAKNILEDINPQLNLDLSHEPKICQTCHKNMLACYEFKYICDNYGSIGTQIKIEDNTEVFIELQSNGTKCGFCTNSIDEIEEIRLRKEFYNLQKSLASCLPNWIRGKSTNVPCKTCLETLENLYTFHSVCLNTEEKLKNYYLSEGTDIEGKIDLYKVLHFVLSNKNDTINCKDPLDNKSSVLSENSVHVKTEREDCLTIKLEDIEIKSEEIFEECTKTFYVEQQEKLEESEDPSTSQEEHSNEDLQLDTKDAEPVPSLDIILETSYEELDSQKCLEDDEIPIQSHIFYNPDDLSSTSGTSNFNPPSDLRQTDFDSSSDDDSVKDPDFFPSNEDEYERSEFEEDFDEIEHPQKSYMEAPLTIETQIQDLPMNENLNQQSIAQDAQVFGFYKTSCFKACLVPNCVNNTLITPDKIVLTVPKDHRREGWCNAIEKGIGERLYWQETTNYYVCEDHFNLKEDMKNYVYPYKLIGGKIFLKPGVVPHVFKCLDSKKRKNIETHSKEPKQPKVSLEQQNSVPRKRSIGIQVNLDLLGKLSVGTQVDSITETRTIGIEATADMLNASTSTTQLAVSKEKYKLRKRKTFKSRK